jgi:8-oxo-dGTP pyrophosphatase MutT (NUDIX family)
VTGIPNHEEIEIAVAVKTAKERIAMPSNTKAAKPVAGATSEKKAKRAMGMKASKEASAVAETAQVISSDVVYQGKLFRVVHDKLIEPGGHENERDVVRHNGSAVILAIDNSKSKKNPWVVMERQYRHAAGRFLWELPAGKVEPNEDLLAGAQRELAEETGYRAKKWTKVVEYWASPGFLGESMTLFLAEGLTAGDAQPEEDERIELRLVRLSEILKMIEKGAIQDGKTLVGILLYARLKLKGLKK